MHRSEHTANLDLAPKEPPSWAKPSTCRQVYRPLPRTQHWLTSLLRALWQRAS